MGPSIEAEEPPEWKTEIVHKLFEIYGPNSDTTNIKGLVILLSFLSDIDSKEDTLPRFWRTLHLALINKNNDIFKLYADKLIENINKDYTVFEMSGIMAPNFVHGRSLKKGRFEEEIVSTKKDICVIHAMYQSTDAGLPKLLLQETTEMQEGILIEYRRIPKHVELLKLISSRMESLAEMGFLTVTYFPLQCAKSLNQWRTGNMSGARCAKNCVDSMLTVIGIYRGVTLGTSIGSVMLPRFGAPLGGIIGAVLSGKATNFLAERLTETVFDLPNDSEVEKAYDYLGVYHRASGTAVLKAFQEKLQSLKENEDVNALKIFELQMSMAVIMTSRNEGRL